jgi:hypothetical protein
LSIASHWEMGVMFLKHLSPQSKKGIWGFDFCSRGYGLRRNCRPFTFAPELLTTKLFTIC